MDPASVDVVLVRPRNPANVAAACRALKNMGLGSVRLVGGDPGLGRPEARNLAYGAWDLLDSVCFFGGLREAVADAEKLIEPLKGLGFVVGPPPTILPPAPPAPPPAPPPPPSAKGKGKKDEPDEGKPAKRKKK